MSYFYTVAIFILYTVVIMLPANLCAVLQTVPTMEDDVDRGGGEPTNGNGRSGPRPVRINGSTDSDPICLNGSSSTEPSQVGLANDCARVNGGGGAELNRLNIGAADAVLNRVNGEGASSAPSSSDEWATLGAVGGAGAYPPPAAAFTNGGGGARPKQRPPPCSLPLSSLPRPLPLPDDSDDDPTPSPVCQRRVNGRAVLSRLPVSHSASESDCNLDECVYTYKGDPTPADHNRNHPPMVPAAAADGERNGGRVSPDLDFLEMDFDPSAFDTSEDEAAVVPEVSVPEWSVTGAGLVTVSPPPAASSAAEPAASATAAAAACCVVENGASATPAAGSSREPTPSFWNDPRGRVSPPSSPPRSLVDSASSASSRPSSSSPPNSPPSLSPISSRASSPAGAAAALEAAAPSFRPADMRFNRLSNTGGLPSHQGVGGANSDDNLCGSDDEGDRSPESNTAMALAQRWPEGKVLNRGLARYNLGSASAPAASPSEPASPVSLPHSRSDHSTLSSVGASVVNSGGSDKYQYCCSNDLSDRQQPGGCGDRLRRRENSVFNIPGGAADPNLQHAGCHGEAEKDFMSRKDSSDAALFEVSASLVL